MIEESHDGGVCVKFARDNFSFSCGTVAWFRMEQGRSSSQNGSDPNGLCCVQSDLK